MPSSTLAAVALCALAAATATGAPLRAVDAPSALGTRITPDPAYKPLM